MAKKNKFPINVAIACSNASGEPEIIATTVKVSQDEYDNGIHYDLAKEKAIEDDYEEPMVFFDEKEMPAYIRDAITQNKVHFL